MPILDLGIKYIYNYCLNKLYFLYQIHFYKQLNKFCKVAKPQCIEKDAKNENCLQVFWNSQPSVGKTLLLLGRICSLLYSDCTIITKNIHQNFEMASLPATAKQLYGKQKSNFYSES